MWLFIVHYKLGVRYISYDKRLYILVKHGGYYRSLGFKIYERDRKLISYNTLIKKYFNLDRLFHISQQPEKNVINKRNKIDFLYANKILTTGCEKVVYSRKLHLNSKRMEDLNEDIIYLINEFTKDVRY